MQPDQERLLAIVAEFEGDLDTPFFQAQNLIPEDALVLAKTFIDKVYQEERAAEDPKQKDQFIKFATGQEVLEVFGKENTKVLVDYFYNYTHQTVPFHRDESRTVLNLSINGEDEYKGGNISLWLDQFWSIAQKNIYGATPVDYQVRANFCEL